VNTQSLVTYLQTLLGPVFLGVIGFMAVTFLFKHEITKFAEFIVLAILIAVVFYTPGIIQTFAAALASALGVHG
jgi:hypothetical protein